MAELLFGIPSKGRMHEEAVKWLVGAAMPLDRGVAARGYLARLQGVAGLEVHLLSAGEIAATLDSGKLHIGLTGLTSFSITYSKVMRRALLDPG